MIAVIVASIVILMANSVVVAGLFNCQNTKYCKCSDSTTGVYELWCSQDELQNPIFLVDIVPGKYVKIQCQSIENASSYELLPGLALGHLESFTFKMCPLPQNESLSNLVKNVGVTSLKTLFFQTYNKNLSNTLTRQHFTGLEEISKLVLSSSGLTDLPSDLFKDMKNLKILDLRSNNVNLPDGIFDELSKLDYLELGANNIQQLPAKLFKNLKEIRQINLWKNNLTNITKEIFNGLSHLQALDLSSNNIEYLDTDVFHFMPNLTTLHLMFNNFSHLPSKLFSNNQNLTILKLSDNKRTLALGDRLFANLTSLSSIHLDRCKLQDLPENMFIHSINITKIDVSCNNLQSLPENLFHTQIKLSVLLLNSNNISVLPDSIFTSLKDLVMLDLSFNNMKYITKDLFKDLKSLKELNMANNNLQEINHYAFSGTNQLRIVNFANNYLTFMQSNSSFFNDSLGSYSPLQHLKNLESLNLRNNSLKEIFADWRFSLTLNVLDLSYNEIKVVHFITDLHFLSNAIVVDLSHNLISSIDLVHAEEVAQQTNQSNPTHNRKVILDFNPLHCDCSAYHFVKYFEGSLNPQVRSIIELVASNLSCASPEPFKDMQVTKISSKHLVCPLDHPTSGRKLCPKMCSCTVRVHDKALIIDCSYANLLDIPPLVEFKAMKLQFTELYIQGNKLSHLPNLRHRGYIHVRTINAEYNNISILNTDNIPPNIQVLQLAHNNLTIVNTSVFSTLENNTNIQKLTLGFNPWLCNCDTKDLLLYVQNNYQTVKDLMNITCFGKQLSELSPGELCPENEGVIIAISVFIALLGMLIGILAALYYRYQQEIKVWLFAHKMCLWFVTEEELDKDKIYDAFISYSHKDEEFVTEHLVPELEGGESPFKLCLHYRDWIAGEWIPTQIARSVEDSRRTVVVLSPNFLESVWGRMEFRTAHNNALSEGRARVIIVIYGEIGPIDNLDAELKAYLSTNTYLQWGDPWFWDKLRYALPHPPKISNKSVNTNIQNGVFGDKMDLINPGGKIILNSANVQNGDIKLNGIVNGGFLTNPANGNVKHSDV